MEGREWPRFGSRTMLVQLFLLVMIANTLLVPASGRRFPRRRRLNVTALMEALNNEMDEEDDMVRDIFAENRNDRQAVRSDKLTQTFGNGTCNSEGCVKAAVTLLMNMNKDKSPCDDFYQFACGGYVNRASIPEDRIIVDTIERVQTELTDNLKAIIEERKSSSDTDAIKKLKDFYNACMDTVSIQKQGIRPLQELLESLGGWPVVEGDKWTGDSKIGKNWQKLLYKFRDKGVFYDFLMLVGVAPDPKDTSRYIIHLDQPPINVGSRPVPRQWGRSFEADIWRESDVWSQPTPTRRLDDPSMSVYFNVMVEIAEKMGANKTAAKKELEEVLQFERELADISHTKDNSEDFQSGYNMMDIQDLMKEAPFIDWLEYFNEMIPYRIRQNEAVLVMQPGYIAGLSKLLAKTKGRTLTNFLIWQAVQSVAPYLDKSVQDLIFSLHSYSTGQEKRQSRSLECLTHANKNMGLAMGALYVRKYFNPQAKEKVQDMVNAVKTEFSVILNENEWMDTKTLKKAKLKNGAMVYHVAYPDELLDNNLLDRFYRRLHIHRRHHFTNSLRVNKFRRNFHLSRLRKPVNKDSWLFHGDVANVNALYGVLENSIQIHAGMLHGWFFQPDRPQYLNFGSIGAVIGHEITHGFDDQGRQFDENGNLKDWWDPVTDKKFASKAKCYVDQYHSYVLPEINQRVNGVNTLGENIADNGGVKIAYRSYEKWMESNKAELKLPGMDYTPRQLFWMSYANNWCGRLRKEALQNLVTRGRHSPNGMRVNGPVFNMWQFARDFNCPTSSRMRSPSKCELW